VPRLERAERNRPVFGRLKRLFFNREIGGCVADDHRRAGVELLRTIIDARHGLLSEAHVHKILRVLDVKDRWEQILRPIVQRAFLEHYNPTGSLS